MSDEHALAFVAVLQNVCSYFEKGVLQNVQKIRKIYMKKHLQWKPPLQIFSIAGVLLWVLRKICRTVFFRTPVDGCFGQRNLVIRGVFRTLSNIQNSVFCEIVNG